MDTGRHRGRVLALAAATIALVLVQGCGGDEPRSADSPSTSTGATPTGCDEEDPAACYSLGDIASAYCVVQQVRTLLRDRDLDLASLPDWIDRGDVGGAPRLVDFRPTTLERPSARSADELAEAVRVAGAEIDPLTLDRCISGLDQEQVVRTEGPRA